MGKVTTLEPGHMVRMSEPLKENLRRNGSEKHLEEFGECVGVVIGPVRFQDGSLGPEVDVRWQPSNLRYAYHSDLLELIPADRTE